MALQLMNKKIESLDFIRGLACLLVMVSHIITHKNFLEVAPHAFTIFKNHFWLGRIGVCLFFLLTGYLIPQSLKKAGISAFLKSKFFSIYPVYWLILSIYIVTNIGQYTPWMVVTNFTLFHGYFLQDSIIGPSWMIQMTLTFYLICATLYYFDKLNNSKTFYAGFILSISAAILLSIIRYFTEIKFPVAFPLAIAIMCLGQLFYGYLNPEKSKIVVHSTHLIWIIALFLISMLIISFLAYNRDYGYNEVWYRYFTSYSMGIVCFFLVIKYHIHFKWIDFLAGISYAIFLIHPLFIYFLFDLRLTETVGGWASGLLMVIIGSLLMSYIVSYYLNDKLKKLFERLFFDRSYFGLHKGQK